MKKIFTIFSALVLGLFSACTSTREVETVQLQSEDVLDHADFSLMIDLPRGGKGALEEIRNTVMDVVDSELAYMLSYEGERVFPAYAGDAARTDDWFEYYRDNTRKRLEQMALEEVSEREALILSDADLSPEEKKDMLESVPRWDYDYQFELVCQTPRYVVFRSLAFIYLGGAHGGVAGAGPLTVDKRSGALLTDWFLPDAQEKMQDLLVAGLLDYYSGVDGEMTREELLDHLFIEDGVIPLPQWYPMPSEDGLDLCYQQYEIASYAEGMPSMVIPYKDVAPFLTPAARELLKI